VIAGGIGGRIAMRIAAIMAGDEQQGALTDAEEIVGDITFDGTLALIIFGGALIGMFGGLIYLALRRWLADAGPWRGLAFGVLLLAIFGWAVIEGDNKDFHQFGRPALNIAMFAAIFVIFGLLVPPLFDRMQRMLRPPRLDWRLGPLLVPSDYSPAGLGTLAAIGFSILFAAGMAGAIGSGFGEEGDNAPFFTVLPAYVLLVPTVTGALLRRFGTEFGRLSDLRGRVSALAAALAVIAVPIAFGLMLDVQAITDIFEANG
jgi:hypothetical protein